MKVEVGPFEKDFIFEILFLFNVPSYGAPVVNVYVATLKKSGGGFLLTSKLTMFISDICRYNRS